MIVSKTILFPQAVLLNMMRRCILRAISVAAILITIMPVSGCVTTTTPGGYGYLSGNVTVGPLTPVERIDVTPPPPDPSVFTSRHLLLYEADGKTLVQEISIQPAGYHGTYNVSLAPGTYVLDSPHMGVGGARGLPQTVTIEAGNTTTLDVDIDTGIR
jgi:hypothetical protein